jgi:hypothetical protein
MQRVSSALFGYAIYRYQISFQLGLEAKNRPIPFGVAEDELKRPGSAPALAFTGKYGEVSTFIFVRPGKYLFCFSTVQVGSCRGPK